MPPSDDTRAWVERLVFGPEVARRYTQDSPVLPDVWIAFALAPAKPQELLLTPNMDTGGPHGPATTGQLRRELAERIPPERGRPDAWWRSPRRRSAPALHLAHNQSTVLATLWFDEVVRVVLPMSQWWAERVQPTEFDAQIGRLDAHQQELLARMLANPDQSAERVGLPAGLAKPSPDLLWTVRVAGTVALARHKPDVVRRLQKGGPLTEDHFREVVAAADALMAGAALPADGAQPLVWSVNRNRVARSTVERSRCTVKADAATRVFELSCRTLTWAVLDSGIDATHPAFRQRDDKKQPYPAAFERDQDRRLVNRTRVRATYDFTFVQHLLSSGRAAGRKLPPWLQAKLGADARLRRELRALRAGFDEGRELEWGRLAPFLTVPHEPDLYPPPQHDHGTHVAGTLAADWDAPKPGTDGGPGPHPPASGLHGICPDLQLYDLRILDKDGQGDEFNIISALQFVRHLNGRQDFMAVHGVNLSVSLRHDVANYACGHTPVCDECERVVATGVVVVTAAGNRGFQRLMTAAGLQDGYHSISITDPGNAAGVITVGATHRTQPHAYGVSYFSSRGPTGDGRMKPDLVAPGEKVEAPVPGGYKPMDGTSMAAPHVSGAAALLLARHRELIGQPARVKQILLATATDLGRERVFQGHGMVDTLRALQSV